MIPPFASWDMMVVVDITELDDVGSERLSSLGSPFRLQHEKGSMNEKETKSWGTYHHYNHPLSIDIHVHEVSARQVHWSRDLDDSFGKGGVWNNRSPLVGI